MKGLPMFKECKDKQAIGIIIVIPSYSSGMEIGESLLELLRYAGVFAKVEREFQLNKEKTLSPKEWTEEQYIMFVPKHVGNREGWIQNVSGKFRSFGLKTFPVKGI
jgi:hypothetical protein